MKKTKVPKKLIKLAKKIGRDEIDRNKSYFPPFLEKIVKEYYNNSYSGKYTGD